VRERLAERARPGVEGGGSPRGDRHAG
jgi:hypothetical protein